MLAVIAVLVLMLVVAVIVWRPRDAGIYPLKYWLPDYRNIGRPPRVPKYLKHSEDSWSSVLVEDSTETTICLPYMIILIFV